MLSVTRDIRALGAAILLVGSPLATAAVAQVGYPAFQPPRIIAREFTVAVASATDFTPIVFQWREGTTPQSQLSFDVGVASVDRPAGSNTDFLLGGQFAHELAKSNADMPLDLLFTVGAFTEWGSNQSMLSIPVGISVGHVFPIEGSRLVITPWAHPRIALNSCSRCAGDNSTVKVSVDLGGNFQFTPRLALRVASLWSDNDALGIGLSWTPARK